MFGFGDRLAQADTLVVGSSHAEFGIDAAMLSKGRPFNMALGGGEGLSFAATLLKKYNSHPSLIALDTFAPDPEGPSTEAANVLASAPGVSYLKVFNIWSGFLRDWILQGVLPRVTIAFDKLTFENPIGALIVRDWTTADVTSVYSSGGLYSSPGEVFVDAAKGHVMWNGQVRPGSRPGASLSAIKAPRVVVTVVPYPAYDDTIGREVADRLGALFVHIDAAGLRWWDYHHLNKSSRVVVTEKLLEAMRNAKWN
jgi:hypothetical protein